MSNLQINTRKLVIAVSIVLTVVVASACTKKTAEVETSDAKKQDTPAVTRPSQAKPTEKAVAPADYKKASDSEVYDTTKEDKDFNSLAGDEDVKDSDTDF